MVLDNLKEYKYKVIKRFYLHRLKKGWKIIEKQPGWNNKGEYKRGNLFFDYTNKQIRIARVTKNLLKGEFIRKVKA